MREIKFRAKELSGNKKFVFGFIVDVACTKDNSRGWRIVENLSDGICHTPVDITTLGQFTGLKDKNGVEIYEGDILDMGPTVGGGISYEKVYWYHQSWHPNLDYNSGYYMNSNEKWNVEIIGNIYQHPELINAPQGKG